MPLQEIVTPWDQQPQEWAEPSPALLEAGLLDMALPGVGGGISWQGVIPTRTASWTDGPRPDGIARVATNVSVADTWAIPGAKKAAPITLAALYRHTSNPGTTVRTIGFWVSSSTGLMISPNGGANRAVIAAGATNNSLTGGSVSTSGVDLHAVRIHADQRAADYSINGVIVASTTLPGNYAAAAIDLAIGKQGSDGQSAQPADHLWWGVFGSAVDLSVLREIAAAKWSAIYQRREWAPMAAASGGGVTGASSGTLQLAGSAAGSVLVSGASAGALAISGAAAASVRVTGASTGTLSLSGTATGTVGATGVTGQSSQTLSLTGTSTATVRVSGQSAQTLALSGAAAGSVRVSGASAGTLSITGTATGNTTGAVTGASAGVLSLSGAATGTVRVSGGSAAVLQITGNAGAQIVVRGVSAGVLLMTGGATANNGEPEPLAIRASLSSRTRIRTDGAGTRPAQRSTASRPRQ